MTINNAEHSYAYKKTNTTTKFPWRRTTAFPLIEVGSITEGAICLHDIGSETDKKIIIR